MSDSRSILDRRFAAGEISEQEYLRIRSLLEQSSGPDDASAPQPATSPAAADSEALPKPVPPIPQDAPSPPPSLPPTTPAKPDLPYGATPEQPMSQAEYRSANPPKPGFIIGRLWRGEVSLVRAYWLWGVLISAVVYLLLGFIISDTTSQFVEIACLALIIVWAAFIAVTVWRSATNYTKLHPRRHWGTVAKVIVVLGILDVISTAGRLASGDAYSEAIDNELRSMQAGLPKKLSDTFRWDSAKRDGKTVTYHYTFLGANMQLVPGSETTLPQKQTEMMCQNPETRKFLRLLDAAKFDMYNEEGKHLILITVTEADCKRLDTAH